MSLVKKINHSHSLISGNAFNIFFISQLNKKFYSTESTENADQSTAKQERVFFKEPEVIDGFRVFDVYMNKKKDGVPFDQRVRRAYKRIERDQYARYNKMPIDQDWTNVWPTSSMFKQSAVPLPIRQGFVKNLTENEGLPPEKYGNVELIKIPNFLHLTPPHIKKHCAAIKKFCTPWPKELKSDQDCEVHFPIEITTSTYIYDGPSVRDDRARVVTLKIKVSKLGLDERAYDKLIKLAQDRYDQSTDILTIIADRCPYRRQNQDYANYLLTTLYFEAKQCEDWESEITEEDMREFKWNLSKSKQNILNTVSRIEKLSDDEKVIELNHVKNYKENLTKIFNQGENESNLSQYKQSKKLDNMDALREGWFSELDPTLWPGQCFSLKCDKLLYNQKSKYQDVLVFNNKLFGNVLVLDGRIQCTEYDEFSYQEMISFLPLNSHPNPEKVLIIGGGDGGVARECVKHPLVKQVVQCEIDEDVVKVSKMFLKGMAKGFDSEKLKLHIGDGFEFLKNHKNEFDVIITDSSDPEGPAESLFQDSFYELMKNALRPNGIVCCQGETFWIFRDLIHKIISFAGNIFPSVSYAQTQIPTYPAGCIGFILCSLEKDKKFSEPIHKFDSKTVDDMELKYYNSDIHKAAFILPTTFQKTLDSSSPNYRR